MRRSANCSVMTVLHERAMRRLPGKQKGLSTVEYAVGGALVAAAIISAFEALGVQVGDLIGFLSSAFGG